MKKGNSKVTTVEVGKTWESNGNTFITHNYVLEDDTKIQANHKSEKPIAIGEEVEYEVKRTHETYGDSGSVKKPGDFKPGGKTIMQKEYQSKRMCKSNALRAIADMNNAIGTKRFDSDQLKPLVTFTVGDITGDIEKFSIEGDNHTSRLAAVNTTVAMMSTEDYKTIEEVIEMATKLYNYIIK